MAHNTDSTKNTTVNNADGSGARTTNNTLITQNSKMSLGLILLIIGMAGSTAAFVYGAINNALDNQDARITNVEKMAGQIAEDTHETAGKVDIIEEQVKQLSHKNN